MGTLEIIYGLLFKPTPAINAVIERRSYGVFVLILFLSSISGLVADNLIFLKDPVFAMINLSAGLVVRFFLAFAILFLLACIFHFIAEGLKGEGKVSLLFIALGCSLIPEILISPLSLIAVGIESSPIKVALYLIFKLILLIWIVRLQILAIKEVYKFSMGRAILTYLIPQIALFIFSFTLFTFLLLTFIISMGLAF